jgi:rRNA maturation endonuclease Nob1
VEQQQPTAERTLVRCLDCGTVYDLPLGQDEAEPCPDCGGVGWVALDAGRCRESENIS